MINFFRQIRQRMLTENKFSKYLLYAFGEIILVVIGILIALGVNNWNQEAKDHRTGKDLLVRIHRDLVQDTISFRATIAHNEELREEIKALMVTLYGGVETIDQVKGMSNTYDKALDQVFSPNDNTYKSMLSSGTLGLIQNLELKEEIVKLYSDYDFNRELLASIGDWMIGVASAVDTQTDFIKFGNDVSDIFTTKEMLNEKDFAFLNDKENPGFKMIVRAISGAAFNQKLNNAIYTQLIIRCDTVLRKIDQELKIDKG